MAFRDLLIENEHVLYCKDLHVGGDLYLEDDIVLDEAIIQNTTNASSTSTGALRVAGGAGIAGDVHLGDELVLHDGSDSVSLSSVSGDLLINASGNDINLHSSDSVRVLNTTASTSTSTGALFVSGGVAVLGGLNIAGAFNATDAYATLYGLNVSNSLTVYGGFTANAASGSIYGLAVNGDIDSSSSTSGILTVAGGVGIVKNLFVGGNFSATGSVSSSNLYITPLSGNLAGAYTKVGGFIGNVSRVGNLVTLTWVGDTGTNASADFLTCSAIVPEGLRPSGTVVGYSQVINNSAQAHGQVSVASTGTVAFMYDVATVFTASGNSGMTSGSLSWHI